MPITVSSFASYRVDVEDGVPWRPEDYEAYKFIKALKGEHFRKHASRAFGGGLYYVHGDGNFDQAFAYFGAVIGSWLRGFNTGPLALIPVPNKAYLAWPLDRPRTASLADAIAANIPDGKVVVALGWSQQLPRAHDDPSMRNPARLYPYLTCHPMTTLEVHGRTCILVDDMFTSGSTIQACAARLQQHGLAVPGALCAGRRSEGDVADPFAISNHQIEDFVPQPDWSPF